MKERMLNSVRRKIGKVSFFALIFSLVTSLSGVSYASGQAKTITIQLNDVSLNEAIRQIEKASGYSFFYDENKVDLSHRVSLKAKDKSVGDALSVLLKSTGLTYEISNNQIALVPVGKEKSARQETGVATTALPSVQQEKRITGVVMDERGDVIIGANVVVAGTTNGTVTDVDGQFSLEASGNLKLEVSYIGYLSQVIAVKGATLKIVLREDTQALDEVVVTGYGSGIKKESLTSSISVIKSDDIARTSAMNTSGALVGKIAGINSRQTDGRPGNATKLNIRNMGTPLYVIDGVQKDENSFNNIDFNDIESVSVLKDASASIYGVRAANGVIVVTTKKGKKGSKNVVSINTNYGWQQLSKFPKPADAATYVESYIQSDAIQGSANPKYTKDDLAKWRQGTEKGYRPFDWFDYIFNSAPQYYVGANISGGSEKNNYYIAVSHMNQDAIIVNYGGFDRTNVQMNIDANITNRFRIGAGLNGRIEHKKNPGVPGGDDYWLPIFASYRNLPTSRPFANDNPMYPTQTSARSDTNFAMLNYDRSGTMEENTRVAQLNFNAEYDIIDGLKVKGIMSYQYSDYQLDNQEYTYKLYSYDEATDTYPVMMSMDNPWRERRTRKIEELTGQLQLTYDKTFGVHGINAVVGVETIKRDAPEQWVHSLPASNILNLIDYPSLDTYDDTGKNTQARIGYVGRVNYNYNQKYLVELSARYDGSWKFPPNHRWGFFPSGSVGWRMSEEAFWKESPIATVFSDFKVRASYGLLGDDDLGDDYKAFDYMSGYSYRVNRKNEKLPGATLDGKYLLGTQSRGIAVTNISWIEAQILDIGLDFGFFQGKLSGSVDYFRRSRSGLPESRYDVLIPGEAGFELPKENLKSDMHTGFDAQISWRDQIEEVSYSVGGNITYSRMYDWHQYKPRFGNSWNVYRNSIDERYAHLNWGLEADGQFQSWDEIATWPVDNDRQGNKTLRPGDIKYKDINNDGVINGMDERPIGYRDEDSTPLLNFGINLAAQYKGFDLSMDFAGATGYSFFYEWELRNPFHDGGNSPQFLMGDQWHLSDITDPNSELIPGKYPTMLVGNSNHSNYWNSTFWKKNVSYLKMRNIEIGYSLPRTWLNKAKITEVRVYGSAQNLFCIDNLDGIDPEIKEHSGLQYPTTRVFTIGLNFKF